MIVSARGLRRTYGDDGQVVAVADVDIDVAAGEIVSIMGTSGSGKSTLLHLLGGLERPSAGQVLFEGERVDGLGEAAWARLRRTRIGVVFQAYNLVDTLTVQENVELPARLAGLSARAAAARARELCDRLGLGDRLHARPAVLSGGEQQRVALARAAVNSPVLLLADEPTGALDSEHTGELLALLTAQRSEGQAVLLVTHDVRVATVADRMLTMRDGRVVDELHLYDDGRRRTVAELASLGEP